MIDVRINSIPPKELYYQYVHVKEKAAPVVSQNLTSDKVELTSDAKTFSVALKAAKDSIDVRTPVETNRIEQIRQQIKNGTYSVPGFKVAEKMLGK